MGTLPGGHAPIHVRAATAIVCAIALCAACEDAPTTTVSNRADDIRSYVIGVMKDGPLLITIKGEPYDAPTDIVDASVLNAVRNSMTWTARPQLTTDPARAASTTLYLEVVFNNAVATPCADGVTGGSPQPNGSVRVVQSLCSQGQSLSTVRGTMARSDGPHGNQFKSLIRQATDDLLAEEHHN